MSNYVWNKVICRKEILEQCFLDFDPIGKDVPLDSPYISFNKLFGVRSLNEYADKIGIHISYGQGFSWRERCDGLYEIKFCTRWEYPIQAITKAVELSHDLAWFAVEENHIYVSKFYWDGDVKEDVIYIAAEYDKWQEENEEFDVSVEDPDDSVWYFLPCAKEPWINWPSSDRYARYADKAAVDVKHPFQE